MLNGLNGVSVLGRLLNPLCARWPPNNGLERTVPVISTKTSVRDTDKSKVWVALRR